jgi:DNA-binding response OmpR family regulator
VATKILVVEDDAEYQHLMQVVLENAGYLAALASSAAGALRWLEEPGARPDVILLDIGLPDPQMDGLDLCRALKRNPLTHRIPVIVVTGREENSLKLKAALCSADLVLHKPVKGADLVAAI